MAKRLKKTIPQETKQKSEEQVSYERSLAADSSDPHYVESESSLIMRHAIPTPKGTVFARDMEPETLYANLESTRRMVRLVEKKVTCVVISFYDGIVREWQQCSVKLNYPMLTDLSGLSREQTPKEDKEAIMATGTRKHGAAAKVAKPVSEGRKINEKTGFKEGSVGDKVGLAFLSVKTPESQLEKVTEVVRESFKSKGKSTANDAVERQAKSWIGYLHKEQPKIYGESPRAVAKAAKPAKATTKKESAKKETVAA